MNIHDKRNAFSLQQKKAVLVAVLNQHSEDNIQRRSPKSLAIMVIFSTNVDSQNLKALTNVKNLHIPSLLSL